MIGDIILKIVCLMIHFLQAAIAAEHFLRNRMLEVKMATRKVELHHWLHCLFSIPSSFNIHVDKLQVNHNCAIHDIWFIWQEEMWAPPRKATRIFVARIPPAVNEATFHR